jgi:hypothetical protein
MEEKRQRSMFFPLLLVLLGTVLFLNTLNLIPGSGWSFLVVLWPLLLVAGGLNGLWRGNGFVGPLVLIGIGTTFLLGNLKYLPLGALDLLFRLWPVLIIAFGLDLIIRQRSRVAAAVSILIGILMIGGILWLAIVAPMSASAIRTEAVTQALDGARRADISLLSTIGTMKIDDGAAADNLLDGSVQLTNTEKKSLEYSVNEGAAEFRLASEGGYYPAPFLGPNNYSTWDIKLTGEVPLTVSSQVIIGQQLVDLGGLKLEGFANETILGTMTLTLPASPGITGSAKVTIGELVLRVPAGVPVIIRTDTALTVFTIPSNFIRGKDGILSPEAKDAEQPLDITVDLPIGHLIVETIP